MTREKTHSMDEQATSSFYECLVHKAEVKNRIAPEFYDQYPVHRGLRNKNGTGVLVGLTDVGSVIGYQLVDNQKVPAEGALYYRGIGLADLVKGFQSTGRRGFEETIYLLLFGELPRASDLEAFNNLLDDYRNLPEGFTENMILKIPSKDIMNKLQRSVLVLYSHDHNPDNTEIGNVLLQCIQLIARFPTIIAYGYQTKNHYFNKDSLFIHPPLRGVGTAENILHMIRKDNAYSSLEAETLDLCLVIHAEHGGGNNSAFATHVVASSGTDTYSVIATALGSLKGPKHGGASQRVREMIENIKDNCLQWSNPLQLEGYLRRILEKKAFDHQGLIYGMGHAVYTKSDPRAALLKEKAYALALEKGALDDFRLYANIEAITQKLFKEMRGETCVICANVDLYSGFVYELLGIPLELYTPLFATARIAGWCAHRIEQIASDPKIMRPAYMSVSPLKDYVDLHARI